MKLALDSNVIIAAFAARGLCHSLVEVCLFDHRIFLSDHLLNEIACKLKEKLRLPDQIIEEIIFFLKNHTEIIEPKPLKEQICRDKDDDHVISLALSAKSDYIISGDNDLLALRRYESICILSPRDFWNVLQKLRMKGFDKE